MKMEYFHGYSFYDFRSQLLLTTSCIGLICRLKEFKTMVINDDIGV